MATAKSRQQYMHAWRFSETRVGMIGWQAGRVTAPDVLHALLNVTADAIAPGLFQTALNCAAMIRVDYASVF
jgi:hypothetical protein